MAQGMASCKQQELWSLRHPGAGSSLSMQYAGIGVIVSMAFLICVGIAMISSATISDSGTHFFKMQLVWAGAGTALCLAGAFMPLDWFYRHSHWGMVAVFIPLLYLTIAAVSVKFAGAGTLRFFPCAAAIKGAVRWLRFGPMQVQPSEFAKVALVLFLAAYYGHLPRERIKGFGAGIAVPVGAAGAVLGLVVLGKDLSTSVVIGVMILAIIFLAGVRFRYVLIFILVGAILGSAFILSSPMRMKRITAWRYPAEARESESYQLFRSQICLGVGSVTGTGYSKGYMKTYLPEPHTDFIVAVIGEEFGFVGMMVLLLAYFLMCGCIVAIASQCRRREDLLLCYGVAILILVQALVNVSVVSGWIPPTGITAPFLSYGGSSLISLMFLVGLVMNVLQRNLHDIWQEECSQSHVIPIAHGTNYNPPKNLSNGGDKDE